MKSFSNRLTGLSSDKRDLLNKVLEKEGIDTSRLPIQPRPMGSTDLPLSYAQQSMWFLAKLSPDAAYYSLPSAVRIKGPLAADALKRVFSEILRRHEALRTVFPFVDGKPVQKVMPAEEADFTVTDLSHLPEEAGETQALSMASREIERPFDLEQGPLVRFLLYRIASEDHLLLVNLHHIVWDGWSIGLFNTEMAALYADFAKGNAASLPEQAVQYPDYALWQRTLLSGKERERLTAYWHGKLAHMPQLSLPLDFPRPEVQTHSGATLPFALPEGVAAELETLSKEHDATLFMTLLAAFKILLSRYAGQEEIVVGTPSANRKRREIQGLIGYFANILVLASDLSEDPDFREFLGRVRETVLGAFAHEEMPFDMLVESLKIQRDPARNPLFQVMFALHRESLDALTLDDAVTEPVSLSGDATHFDLGLHLWHRDNRVYGYFSYNTDLFKADTIARMVSHYIVLLTEIAKQPEQRISDLSLISEVETEWLRENSRLPLEPVSPGTVHDLFREQAAKTPHAPALTTVPAGTDASTGAGLNESEASAESLPSVLSYGELLARAEETATRINGSGLRPGAPVGICLTPGPDAVTAVLGTLFAGGVVVPVSPDLPQWEQAALMTETDAGLVITAAGLEGGFREPSVPILLMDGETPETLPPSPETRGNETPGAATPSETAQICRASGRGIRIPHHRILGRVRELEERFGEKASEKMLLLSRPGDEAFIWEMLWPLLTGRCLVPDPHAPSMAAARGGTPIAEQEMARVARALAAVDIQLAHFTPESLSALLETVSPAEPSGFPKTVLVSGGLLHPETRKLFFRRFSCDLVYLYAPPETSGIAGLLSCGPGKESTALTPGNRALRVLDEKGRPSPPNVPGRIYVEPGGPCLSGSLSDTPAEPWENALVGAWKNDPAPDPLFPENTARLMKTAERGRVLPDKTIELIAPFKERIWKNGRRMDPALVEAALLEHPEVESCSVIWRPGSNSHELSTFVVTSGIAGADGIMAFLEGRLAPELIPSAVVRVSHLPLTSNGSPLDAALERIAVKDARLALDWETQIAKASGVKEVKVVAREKAILPSLIHIADLLPDHELIPSGSTGGISPGADGALPAPAFSEDGEPLDPGTGLPVPMAYATGGELHYPDDAPRTLSEALIRHAANCAGSNPPASDASDADSPETEIPKSEYGKRGLLLVQQAGSSEFLSYSALFENAKRVLAGLQDEGLLPGDRVLLQLETLRDHFSAFWGCVLGGIIPVTVAIAPDMDSPNSVLNKLRHTWELLDHPRVITNERLAAPLYRVTDLFEEITERFSILRMEALTAVETEPEIFPAKPGDTVFLQLTSGSTGAPKCIQETHSGIIHHILGSSAFNGYTEKDVSLNWLPMDHVVPILTCHLKDTFLGTRQVHVATSLILADPLLWIDLMEAERVTHTWAPNFGFKLVSDRLSRTPGRKWDLSAVRFFMNAGEQVTLPVVASFLKLLEPSGIGQQAMQPAFGMAEVCTCMTYRNDFSVDTGVRHFVKSSLGGMLVETNEPAGASTFVDLGPPMPGVEIRITDDENRPVREGVIGRFQIRGKVTTPGYLKNAKANAEAFVGDGWFNSGDLGFIKDGHLSLTGREKEMIVIRGANFYCHEIEDVVNAIEGVEPTFSAACSLDDPDSGTEGLALFLVPREPEPLVNAALLQAVKSRVAMELGVSPQYVIPMEKEAFPKTTSGKIQRSGLKKALLGGAFKERIREIELALETPNTMPDWFFSKQLHPVEPSLRPVESITRNLLVFADKRGVWDKILGNLGDQGTAAGVRVDRGALFTRLSERHYTLNPQMPEHYQMLLEHLGRDGISIEQVLHLWGSDFPEASRNHDNPGQGDLPGPTLPRQEVPGNASGTNGEAGARSHTAGESCPMAGTIYSPLEFVRALEGVRRDGERVRMLIVSAAAPSVESVAVDSSVGEKVPVAGTAGENVPVAGTAGKNVPMETPGNPALLAGPAIVKTMVREMPWLDCRHLGLDAVIEPDLERDARIVLTEARAITRHGEVIARGDKRLVPFLEKIHPEKRRDLPFNNGDVVLISGGLGGIGLEITAYLLQNHQARVVLLGRSPLDGEAENTFETAQSLAAPTSAEGRINLLKQLAGLGGQVVYEAADVGNEEAVRTVVKRAEERWEAPLSGVIHLAGIFPPRLLSEETRESFAAVLHPKLEGARVLSRVLGDGGWFISFGSLYGNLGGTASGAYAAANHALEAFTLERNRRLGNSLYVAWSNWDETGMSRGYLLKEQSRGQGYFMIEPRKGVLCLLAALRSGLPSLVVGLDDTRPAVRPHVKTDTAPVDELTAFYTSDPAFTPPADLSALMLPDRFGTPSGCRLFRIPEMPLTKAGEIDTAALLAMDLSGTGAKVKRVAPRTGMERTIAAIWKEVLGLESVGIHQSFFELGGQSILLAQVQIKLCRAINRDIPVVDLFRYPTISTLAAFIGQGEKEKPTFKKVTERAQKRKTARRKKGRPARPRAN